MTRVVIVAAVWGGVGALLVAVAWALTRGMPNLFAWVMAVAFVWKFSEDGVERAFNPQPKKGKGK